MVSMWTFSADVPHDGGVHDYIAHRGGTRLPMNVSAEADAAYIAEKGLKLGPTILKSWPIGICSRCHGVIRNAPYVSMEPGKFCSRECLNGGAEAESTSRRRTRHYKNCKQCRGRFLAKRTDQEFCKPKCRARWTRRTDNCNDPFGTRVNTNDNEGVFAV